MAGSSIWAECVHITDETGGPKGRRTLAIEGEGWSLAKKADGLELAVSGEIRILELAGAECLVDVNPIGGRFKGALSSTKRANEWLVKLKRAGFLRRARTLSTL